MRWKVELFLNIQEIASLPFFGSSPGREGNDSQGERQLGEGKGRGEGKSLGKVPFSKLGHQIGEKRFFYNWFYKLIKIDYKRKTQLYENEDDEFKAAD